MTGKEYQERIDSINKVIKEYCKGKRYDSCKESPCPYSSHSGCQEPHIRESFDKLTENRAEEVCQSSQ